MGPSGDSLRNGSGAQRSGPDRAAKRRRYGLARCKQASSDGRNAVRLAYRWKDPTGKKVLRDYDNRTDLPKPLPAGESLSLTVDVKTPAEKGRALLQVDLVQEGVAWFESKGAAPLVVTVEVQ